MNDTSGFYKLEDGIVIFAPNFVYGSGFELLRENPDAYDFPVCGWYWFETELMAHEFFNVKLP